jgi:tungstate transport system ATP-binding protein
MIRFEEVTVAVGNVTVLDRLTLAIAPGGPTVLIGPNGAGKTTVLRVAMGLLRPSAGRIEWHGEPRRAIVFQRPTMLRRSALANVRYASVGRDRTRELLELVGLAHVADRPARRLSSGEQQRLALARALARDPEVLFLDEPTASLDPGSTKAVEDVIRAIGARGIKVVMSTHDLGEARRLAAEVVLLHRGRIVEVAAAPGFFDAPGTAAARRFMAGELLL